MYCTMALEALYFIPAFCKTCKERNDNKLELVVINLKLLYKGYL